ncbi:hypothetical protein A2859_01290 [Candidatus Roizmanbacteria bacterium RIFCSPHIGHO2_01_FULL_37_16b]|nr:MAG: hypothetical protein A2859_01290 [Candidatus Roizmanbacteria bacterium RIFCSPHIGHO2_01_FULL_37_16b]
MKNQDFKLILFFLFLFIFLRSVNFKEHLNFSFDQAWSSTRVLEIWKNKEITLVGPGSSLIANGKQVLQGSINYYFQLIFLLIGRFDPILSSYFLMFLNGLMLIPLYFGVKLLSERKTAIFILLIYTLLPYFIDFTRFFFGPVYQLSLLPLLVLLMGFYKKLKKNIYLFFVFVMAGILLQFHYQIIVLIFILSIYYLWKTQNKIPKIFLMSIGLILGYFPMIVFEVKNQFYNFKVLAEYIKFSKKPSDFFFIPHRYLSISLILLIISSPIYKKFLKVKTLIILGLALFSLDLFLYLPKPKNAFGMSPNWNYLMETKAYQIIKKEDLKNFNVVNLTYDNLSVVIKYHLKLDNYPLNYDDYYHNEYLFVINKDENIFNNPAYEVNTFKPNIKLKQWKLNDTYNLYLFKRLKKDL